MWLKTQTGHLVNTDNMVEIEIAQRDDKFSVETYFICWEEEEYQRHWETGVLGVFDNKDEAEKYMEHLKKILDAKEI